MPGRGRLTVQWHPATGPSDARSAASMAHALERGFGAVTLGWMFDVGRACTVARNVIGGALSDRWGREWVFALGSAIGVAGIGCLGRLSGPDDPRAARQASSRI